MSKTKIQIHAIPDNEIKYLRIDSIALMKIARHDQEGVGEGGWGQLLGIQHESNYIEVSDCFPLLTKDLNAEKHTYESAIDLANGRLNIEQNKVGWYMISSNNDFLSSECLKYNFESAFANYKSIFLVYDKLLAASGHACPFKAYKLSEAWSNALYKVDEQLQLDLDIAKTLKLNEIPIYTEIEVRIKVNPLTRLFLLQHESILRPDLLNSYDYKATSNIQQNSSQIGENLGKVEQGILTLTNPNKPHKKAQLEYICDLSQALSFTGQIQNDAGFNLSSLKFAKFYQQNSN